MNIIKISIPVILVAIFGFFVSAFVVDQRQFGVVYTLGEISRVEEQPGLYFKIPLLQNVTYFDNRLLMLASGKDSSDTEPLYTKEQQRIVVDWYVRWRVVTPKAYIQNVGVSEKAGEIKLAQLVRNAFQDRVNKYTLEELLSTKREELMQIVKDNLVESVGSSETQRGWGIEITDVRITRVDYVKSITVDVYSRMQANRKKIANEWRSKGAARGEKIRAEADRKYEEIVAEANKNSLVIKGKADAKANELYLNAFAKDPEFARFYRNIQAYKESIKKGSDVMVLDSSADFFKFLRNSESK